jgi:hypothetical protein
VTVLAYLRARHEVGTVQTASALAWVKPSLEFSVVDPAPLARRREKADNSSTDQIRPWLGVRPGVCSTEVVSGDGPPEALSQGGSPAAHTRMGRGGVTTGEHPLTPTRARPLRTAACIQLGFPGVIVND